MEGSLSTTLSPIAWIRSGLRSRLIGGAAAVFLLTLLYWVPLGWWVLRYSISGALSLPPDLPFLPLLRRTFMLSGIASGVAILAAYPLALLWRVSSNWTRHLIVGLMVVPLILGLLARNYSWVGMLSSNAPRASLGWSLIGGTDLLYTASAVVLVMSCAFIPIAFFLLAQGVAAVTQDHVDAARTLGASDPGVLIFVVLPQSFRAALLAFGVIFAMSIGFFITPRMLGGGKYDFVSNAVLALVNFGDFSAASSVALYFLLWTAIPAAIVTVIATRRRHLVTGR